MWAIKCCSLRLYDPHNLFLTARRTDFTGAIVDAVMILIAAGLIEGISVRSVRKRRALVLDREIQHLQHVLVNRLPLGYCELIAPFGRMNGCEVENFRGVQIADTRNCPLIKKSDFNRAATRGKPRF